jgi:uncharacterized membrane protein
MDLTALVEVMRSLPMSLLRQVEHMISLGKVIHATLNCHLSAVLEGRSNTDILRLRIWKNVIHFFWHFHYNELFQAIHNFITQLFNEP